MKKYVNENMLNCIKKNDIYPQDIDYNKCIFLHFGKIGLDVIKLTNKGEFYKHVGYWQDMTAEQINKTLDVIGWIKEY